MKKKTITIRESQTRSEEPSPKDLEPRKGKSLEELVEIAHKNYTTGAFRATDADQQRFDACCPTAYARWAEICAEGIRKYGVHNWTKGMPLGETLSHAERHLNIAKRGGDHEGPPVLHLAKVLWNVAALIHFLQKCECHKQEITQP